MADHPESAARDADGRKFRNGATGHALDVADAQDRYRGPETGAGGLNAGRCPSRHFPKRLRHPKRRGQRRETMPTPYLFFEGRCEEAIEFYKKTLGAKVEMLMRFKESPEKNPNCTPADDNKIMHASFKIGDTMVMGSDGMASGKPDFKGFSLTVTAKDE